MEKSVYRIIDANFNRSREAIRVIEEFCRFALNSELLAGRAKQLRHELCGCIDKIDSAKLIASRDTIADVGVGQKVENQLQRGELKDTFTAACKRLVEALRVLGEMSQTVDPLVAEEIESLRYRAYTLEKDITLFSDTTEKFKRVRLYIIITSSLPSEIISLAYRCIAGGADCIQLRAKGIEDDKLFAIALEFVRICRKGGVLSIINDRADIAIATGADGVHLGQNDLPIEQVKRLQSYPLIIGKSTHSIKQLRAACEELVTYAALGPVFTTPTKPGAEAVGLDYVREGTKLLAEAGIGHVAIGGITEGNIVGVLKAGAKTISVCSAVTQSSDPISACRSLREKIAAFGDD